MESSKLSSGEASVKATMENPHFLLVALPVQSSLNPSLQLAKNLVRTGAKVTFATTVRGGNQIKSFPKLDGLSFASFSDGYDGEDDSSAKSDPSGYMDKLKRLGSQNLIKLLQTFSDEGRPVSFLIYTLVLPWVADVARDVHLPSALLCVQNATAFAIYHHLFNSEKGLCGDGSGAIDSSISIQLTGLPLLTSKDFPTFLFPSSPLYAFATPFFREHIRTLEQDHDHCVLLNTFEELEADSIKDFDNSIKLIPVGPLIPSAFSDGNDSSDKSFGCDLFDSSKEHLQWLNSKQQQSVIYVSFGSLAELQKRAKEEILEGLLSSGRPFLWVIRPSEKQEDEFSAMVKDRLLSNEGMVIPWCSQVEVLHHQSIGCFVTHCGWNSTLESIVAGVPIVGCPQFSDQTTNVKLIEEYWRIGVRANVKDDEEGLVTAEEIKICLDLVMGSGERAEEMRRNCRKWRSVAVEATKEGGSSHNNLKHFVNSLKSG